MADPTMVELRAQDLRLQAANALVIVDELLLLALKAESEDAAAKTAGTKLLKREVEVVLQHARELAGLNPDGTFDEVPKPKPAKRGGK